MWKQTINISMKVLQYLIWTLQCKWHCHISKPFMPSMRWLWEFPRASQIPDQPDEHRTSKAMTSTREARCELLQAFIKHLVCSSLISQQLTHIQLCWHFLSGLLLLKVMSSFAPWSTFPVLLTLTPPSVSQFSTQIGNLQHPHEVNIAMLKWMTAVIWLYLQTTMEVHVKSFITAHFRLLHLGSCTEWFDSISSHCQLCSTHPIETGTLITFLLRPSIPSRFTNTQELMRTLLIKKQDYQTKTNYIYCLFKHIHILQY